jgi:ABC-type glycerol-3-phosphate transport system substrate-binding protein
MKRLAIGMVAIAALTLSLSACASSGGTNTGGTPSILLWVDTPREPAAKLYAEQMKGKVDVKVEVIAQTDAQTKIALHNQTKSGWPDVIFGTAADTALFLDPSNGFAAPLTDLVPQKIFDGYGQGNNDCKFNGVYYCLKNDLAQTVLWYDTTLFAKFNLTVPSTMEEFAADAMKLQGTGYVAGAIGDQNYYASFLQASECPLADVVKPNVVRINPDAPECSRVAKLMQPLLDAGVVDKRSSFDAGFIADTAKAGKVVMTLGPSWFGDFVIKPAESWGVPAGRIAAAPMPQWAGATTNTSGAYGGGVFTVSAHSKFPQAAADAAIWLTTSPDAQTTAPTFPAYGPANQLWKDRISKDTYYASDIYPAMAAQADKISQLDRPVRFAFVNEIGTTLQTAINGGKSLDTALHDYASALQKLAPASGYTVVTK